MKLVRLSRSDHARPYLPQWPLVSSRKSHRDFTSARAKHRRYMELLAQDTNLPLREVAALYENTLANLRARARIVDYLPIFTWRRVRSALKARALLTR